MTGIADVAGERRRPRWDEVPAGLRAEVERLVGGPVSSVVNCPGGFSPGVASRLMLADGRSVFVKAMDAHTWPDEAATHRVEATVAASLPAAVPAPRLIATIDDGGWVVLVLDDVDGTSPVTPWSTVELRRVVEALSRLTEAVTPSPIPLPSEHPRLGGWTELAEDPVRRARLLAESAWAADRLDRLVRLEQDGLVAAHGRTLVHGDLYPHNILLTADQVQFVDWPHARLGHPAIDLIVLLSSAAADGLDPEPFLTADAVSSPGTVDAILAAHTGFLLAGGLSDAPPGLAAIPEAKLRLGRGALRWLCRRLTE